MNIEIYSTCPATELAPNVVIDAHPHGPILVDEVRLSLVSARTVVDAYGRRPDAPEESKQRRRIRYAADEEVRLAPTEEAASSAWVLLVDAVEEAASNWENEHPDEPAPWTVVNARKITVHVGGAVVTFADPAVIDGGVLDGGTNAGAD